MNTNQLDFHYLFKFIVVGDSSVGKSCLINKYTQNQFKEETECTIGIEFGCKTVTLQEQIIKLQIWDTAGQESYKSITRSYYRGSIGGLIVYDITSKDSFENVCKWIEDIKNHACDRIEMVLVGNKQDKEEGREISFQEAFQYARKQGLQFYETSAKSGKNVESLFNGIALQILKKIESNQIDLNIDIYGIKIGSLAKSKIKQNNQLIDKNEKEQQQCC